MKLDYKRTFLVGLAFMSICMFWQMYDSIIPLILKNTFHLNDTLSGVIMALDNIIALFLLPLFGNVSDKCNNKIGKRMPFIVLGTVMAVALMTFLPVIDNIYFQDPAGGLRHLLRRFLHVPQQEAHRDGGVPADRHGDGGVPGAEEPDMKRSFRAGAGRGQNSGKRFPPRKKEICENGRDQDLPGLRRRSGYGR